MQNKKRKPGKPITHQKIKNVTTGDIFETFTEAADAIGGCRVGVYRCCNHIQRHHHKNQFIFLEEDQWETEEK